MTEPELRDALDGLSAYDGGSTDSGIHDDRLKQGCRDFLDSLPGRERQRMLARITRDLFFTDTAIEQGYGLEDAVSFGRWLLDDDMRP